MKNNIFKIKAFSTLALAIGILMASVNIFAPSWSQNAGTSLDPFLYATLILISFSFLISSSAHPQSLREITKFPFNISFKLKHAHTAIALFFGGVIIFSVNNTSVEWLHLLFTALAIGTGYVTMLIYPETINGKMWAWIGFIIGIGGFLLGFLFHTYSIAYGEVIAAIPLVIWNYVTLHDV